MAGLPLLAPEPPLALLQREVWILCLGNRGHENVKATDVLRLSFQSAELSIKLAWLLL
jgi:hypothetical protein